MVIFLCQNFGIDLFDTVNTSACYQNVATKPKFGPYHGPRPTLAVIHF